MKINVHKLTAVFAVVVLILTAIWLTRSCAHKPIVTTTWKPADSLAYYKKLAQQDSAISSKHTQQYEQDYNRYLYPDSVGRDSLGARIWNAAIRKAEADSVRKRAPR